MVKLLLGAALGFLSGLGVGGGSLLLLWLTVVMDVPQETARVMNLMFFLPSALTATWFRRREAKPDRSITVPAIAAALLGAVFGNFLGPMLDTSLLKKAFGLLFIICGIRELRWKVK